MRIKQYIFCLQDFFLLDTTNWKWSGNIYRVHFRLCAKKIFGSVYWKQINFSCNPLFHLIQKKVLFIWYDLTIYCLDLINCFLTFLCTIIFLRVYLWAQKRNAFLYTHSPIYLHLIFENVYILSLINCIFF